MTDAYETRKNTAGSFTRREERVDYSRCFDNYDEDGYIIFKKYFSKKELSAILSASASGLVTQDPNIKVIRSTTGVHYNSPFTELSENARLVDLVSDILGSNIYMHQSRINYKSGMGANGWHWHSDFETWHAQDGMPGMRCLSAMIPLSVNANYNGPLMVIPGSHKWFYSCPKMPERSAQENFADQKEGLPDSIAIQHFIKVSQNKVKVITCAPGDLVLFDCNIIHGSTVNMTPFSRTNLYFVYNSVENMLTKPFSASAERPEEMATRKNVKVL